MDKAVLAEIIEAYRANFTQVDREERYKWEAVACFQNNWDMDAPDFALMLKNALAKAQNLLPSSGYYAKKMITALAERDPGIVRSAFSNLFDES